MAARLLGKADGNYWTDWNHGMDGIHWSHWTGWIGWMGGGHAKAEPLLVEEMGKENRNRWMPIAVLYLWEGTP